MFTRNYLAEIRRKAIRQRIWFKYLDNVERGILSLTARIVYRVESAVLRIVLAKIVKKIREYLKSEFVRRMEEYGLMRARTISRQALIWGYRNAILWGLDLNFIRYLTIINLNRPTGFGF